MVNLDHKKVAIYGGSFNPIHIGHLITGLDILNEFDYDYIMYIPAHIPSHKNFNEAAGSHDRMKMLQLSINHYGKFISNDLEILRGGISYTIDTIQELHLQYPTTRFGVIFGDDLLAGLSRWKGIDVLNQSVDLICLSRNPEKQTQYSGDCQIQFAHNRIIEISSSEIRYKIKTGLPINYLVTAEVHQYIIQKKLYQTNTEEK